MTTASEIGPSRRAGIVLALSAVLAVSAGAQQPPAERATDRPRPDAARPAGQRGAPSSQALMDQLSDADKERLRLAVQQVWHDPEVSEKRRAVQAATREFRDALKAAISAQEDPQLRRVMNRLLAEHYLNEIRAGRAEPPKVGGATDVPDSRARAQALLTPAEHRILQQAREKAMGEPRVTAAIRMRESAVDHQQRMLAARRFRETMRAAMVAADPRVAEIFRKLEAGAKDRPDTRRPQRDR